MINYDPHADQLHIKHRYMHRIRVFMHKKHDQTPIVTIAPTPPQNTPLSGQGLSSVGIFFEFSVKKLQDQLQVFAGG